MTQLIPFLPLIVQSIVSLFSFPWAVVAGLVTAIVCIYKQQFFLEWCNVVHSCVSFVCLFLLKSLSLYTIGSICFTFVYSIFSFVSLILKQPFTLEYAKRKVAKELWGNFHFYRCNFFMTLALGLFFLLEGGTKILTILCPAVFNYVYVKIGYSVALFLFIRWFPKQYISRIRVQRAR